MHKKNTRPPDLFGIKFTGPKLKSLALGLQSSVKFEPCACGMYVHAKKGSKTPYLFQLLLSLSVSSFTSLNKRLYKHDVFKEVEHSFCSLQMSKI